MENREYLCLFTRPAMSLQQMCLGRNLLSIILYLLSITLAGAYTVEWALPPVYYPSIIRCAPGIFQVASSTASHVVDIKANKSLFKGENGQVFCNRIPGYHISVISTGKGEYDRELRGFLFEEDNHVVLCKAEGLFPGTGGKGWGYPTENTLRVRDEDGQVGYVGLDGNLLIKCQFEKGRPFRDGFALVQTHEGNWMYITKDYDITHQPLKLSVGEIFEGMQFSQGRTWVSTKKGWICIDQNGKKVKTDHIRKEDLFAQASYYSEDCIRINIKQEMPENYTKDTFQTDDIMKYQTSDSLIGYKRLGKDVVPAQFKASSFTQDFDCGYAAVCSAYDDYMGILKLLPGDFVPLSADSVSAVTDGRAAPIEVKLKYPTALDASKLQVMVDMSHLDNLIEVSDAQFNDGICQFSFVPMAGEGECEMTYQIYSDYDLLLFEETQPLTFVNTAQASIGKVNSLATTNENMQTLWTNIHVPPHNKAMDATFEILIDGKLLASSTARVGANEMKRVEVTVPVERSCGATARITLSNGQKKEYKVNLSRYADKGSNRGKTKVKKEQSPTRKRKYDPIAKKEAKRIFVPY